ncbi:MAG: FAD-dependent oxidoreductase [Opitutaceae bacterium]
MESEQTDILVVGGGVGGCAAALAAASAGHSVIMTEECDWIGGQFTSQAVPPDEHGWIEHFGSTATYRSLRHQIRVRYRSNPALKPEFRDTPFLNPGNGWVSPLCHEPRVALSVLEGMLAPAVAAGRLTIHRNTIPIAVDTDGEDVIAAVTFRRLDDNSERRVRARYVIDATENGDLLPLSGTEFVTGAEAKTETGEADAGSEPEPDNVQAFSVCFVVDHDPQGNHVGAEPADYAYWRDFVPPLHPPWPGPWLGWKGLHPRTMEPFDYHFDPTGEPPGPFSGLWSFRRIIDRRLFVDGAYPSDLCLVNWPMIDYVGGHLLTGDSADRESHISAARRQSLSFFHWLQTEAPRPDGGFGWPGLRMRGDITGSADGLAKMPYIRESRRIRAEFTVRQSHVAETDRPGELLAEPFDDSVGIGYYRIDLHPTTGGDNYLDVGSLPFQVPLGALIPVRMENLLPGAKNIGTTHITNGCYRLHPVEWTIGEAAGNLAAHCLDLQTTPRTVYRDPARRRAFQCRLKKRGVELSWPQSLNLEEGDPHAHARHPIVPS